MLSGAPPAPEAEGTMRPPKTLTTLLAVGAAALAAAPATASAPTLSLKAADRHADRHADRVSDRWTDGDRDVAEFDVDACERTGRTTAQCAVTYVLSDGVECDDTLTVTRRSASRANVAGQPGAGPGGERCWDPQEDEADDEALDLEDEDDAFDED